MSQLHSGSWLIPSGNTKSKYSQALRPSAIPPNPMAECKLGHPIEEEIANIRRECLKGQSMALVFQYGSNMSTARLNSRDRLRGDAHAIGIAQTEGEYEFVFDIWSISNNCAAADLLSGNGRRIWGVLYEIPGWLIGRETAAPRKSLDFIEGEGHNYTRQKISLIDANGEPVRGPVITYVGLCHRPRIETSIDYVKHILVGLREHRIPEEYVDYVKNKIVANNPSLELIARPL
ncbi:MAG: gamma-glutamylcyclotransferase [Anaerolineales bacterium]|nr:MAG: gamma-glutamylcyclotransferase [Anaerolineales bacterium]